MKIQKNILINATPDKIWSVLTDFGNFKSWNPFIKKAEGLFKVGEQIKIEVQGTKFKPTVLKFDHNKELRWLGKLGVSGLFDGEHYFLLEEQSDGRTKFIHGENFKGILVPLFKKKLLTEVSKGFEEMNQALKTEAEKG